MNILIFSWRDPKHPLAGGAEQSVHEHAKGWIAAGNTVTLFSSLFKGGLPEEDLDGVHIIRKGNQLLGVQIAVFFWYLFQNGNQFDLVIDCFHGIPFFTPLFISTKKIALIQEVAKEVWLLNHLPRPLNIIVGFIGFLLEPIMFLFYKNVPFMTASKSTKEDLVKFGIPSRNITIIPHGVIINYDKKLPTKEKLKTITFLGTVARDKGIEDVIKTFNILNNYRLSMRSNEKFNFWVLGSGVSEYVNYIKQLSSRLGIAQEIHFFGFVSEEEKFNRLARSHILINPSVREGWGLVNIEANRMGTPVVAYRSPGLVDSVSAGNSGVLCQQNTPDDLAKNILRILDDNDLYRKLCKDSIAWSNNFTWEKSKTMSINLIEKIVNTG